MMENKCQRESSTQDRLESRSITVAMEINEIQKSQSLWEREEGVILWV